MSEDLPWEQREKLREWVQRLKNIKKAIVDKAGAIPEILDEKNDPLARREEHKVEDYIRTLEKLQQGEAEEADTFTKKIIMDEIKNEGKLQQFLRQLIVHPSPELADIVDRVLKKLEHEYKVEESAAKV